jgi:hypothetical protein
VDGEETEGPAPRPARVKRKAHAVQLAGGEKRKVALCLPESSYTAWWAFWLSASLADVTLACGTAEHSELASLRLIFFLKRHLGATM